MKENLQIDATCRNEAELLESVGFKRFLNIANQKRSKTGKEPIRDEELSHSHQKLLELYEKFRKLSKIRFSNSNPVAFVTFINNLLISKLIEDSKYRTFPIVLENVDLRFFHENLRTFINNGIVPVQIVKNTNERIPIFALDQLSNDAITERGDVELLQLPPGIELSNLMRPIDPEEIKTAAEKDELGFSEKFEGSHLSIATASATRHMDRIDEDKTLWSEPVTFPKAKFASEPLEQIRQYGTGLFEGIGVEIGINGKPVVFRLRDHWERMNKGGLYFDMPKIPFDIFEKMVLDTVKANRKYIPPKGKGRLYIRPNWFNQGAKMHVGNSDEQYTLMMTAVAIGRVESYFGKGEKTFFIPTNVSRATDNGPGQTKGICNYAQTIRINNRAHELGMAGVLYMDQNHDRIEETLASSFIIVKKDESGFILRTPKLDHKTILDSITRKTLLELAQTVLGWRVVEEDIKPNYLMENDNFEVYACGTGAGLAPIHSIRFGSFNNENGEIEGLNSPIEVMKYGESSIHGEAGKILLTLLLKAKNGELQSTIKGYNDWLTEAA